MSAPGGRSRPSGDSRGRQAALVSRGLREAGAVLILYFNLLISPTIDPAKKVGKTRNY